MTLEQYAHLAQIIGVVLVIASLIYVARQLNQTTEMLKSESRQALLANDQSALRTAMEHRDLFELITKPEPLSFQDQFRMSMMWAIDLRNREHEYLQYKAGVLDRETWLSYREVIKIMFDNERGRKWWDSIGRGVFPGQFAQMIDEIAASTSLDDTYRKFGTWD